MKKHGYIYKITHIPSGRYYIGQKCGDDPMGDGYMGSGAAWKQILKSHDKFEFRKEVLMFAKDQEELNEFEQEYIGNLYKTDKLCKNLTAGGGGISGYTFSEELKQKLSDSHKGQKPWNKGIKMDYSPRKGAKLSERTRQKLSESHKGLPSPRKGAKLSEETKRKLSESHKGNTMPEETRRKISLTLKRRFKNG